MRCSKDPHGSWNILDLNLAHILQGNVHPVANLIARGARQAYAPRVGKSLQSRRHIDAVAKQIAVLVDDVANVMPTRN